MNTQLSAICIADTQIREINGLYSLADLHKASGGQNKHRPSLWLRNQQAIDFIEELTKAQICALEQNQELSAQAKQALLDDENSLRENVIKVVNGGKHGSGTYVCKELVVHYGMWISPEFSIKVIQTFLHSQQKATEPVQPALPPSHKYALDVNEMHQLADLPLATYLYHLIRFYARAYGISQSSVNSLLADKFNYGKPIHKMSLNTLTRSVMWMHEELDKVPCVDFGVSRSDLLNIFKRQCQYKRDFENWSEWQLQSWLDEMFFRSEKTRYMGYPTSLESATYAQLEKLVDGMKHYLSGDFQLLANSLREQNRVLPKLRGDDGSIGQVLCSYGAGSPDSIAVSWALQDMTILRRVFDYFTFLSYENGQQDEEWAGDIRSCNVILNHLSTMLLEASSHTLMKS